MEHGEKTADDLVIMGVPKQAIDYLRAVRQHYQPGVSREPTNVDIYTLLRIPARTWDYQKKQLRNGHFQGRDWIEIWPPPEGWCPSWEGMLDEVSRQAITSQVALRVLRCVVPRVDENGNSILVEIEETYDANGLFIAKRLLGALPARAALTRLTSAAAAMYLSFKFFDASDGHLDGVIHFCSRHFIDFVELASRSNWIA